MRTPKEIDDDLYKVLELEGKLRAELNKVDAKAIALHAKRNRGVHNLFAKHWIELTEEQKDVVRREVGTPTYY